MTHLIYVNVIIVVLDIAILGLEYSGLYDIQTVYKGFVYSVKLKFEFSILNRLIELTRSLRLETFDEDGRKQTATGNDKQAGYKAYVTSGRAGSAGTSGVVNCNNDSIVVTRTQVVIDSEVHTTKTGCGTQAWRLQRRRARFGELRRGVGEEWNRRRESS
jgi:hypothetical protein